MSSSCLDPFQGRSWSQLIIRPKLQGDEILLSEEGSFDLLRCRECRAICKCGYVDKHRKKCEQHKANLPKDYQDSSNLSSSKSTLTRAKHYYHIPPIDNSANPDLCSKRVHEPPSKKRKVSKSSKNNVSKNDDNNIILPPSMRTSKSKKASAHKKKPESLYHVLFHGLTQFQPPLASTSSATNTSSSTTTKQTTKPKRKVLIKIPKRSSKTNSTKDHHSSTGTNPSTQTKTSKAGPSSTTTQKNIEMMRNQNNGKHAQPAAIVSTVSSSPSTLTTSVGASSHSLCSTVHSNEQQPVAHKRVTAWDLEEKRIEKEIDSAAAFTYTRITSLWHNYAQYINLHNACHWLSFTENMEAPILEATHANKRKVGKMLLSTPIRHLYQSMLQYNILDEYKPGGAEYENYKDMHDIIGLHSAYKLPSKFSNGTKPPSKSKRERIDAGVYHKKRQRENVTYIRDHQPLLNAKWISPEIHHKLVQRHKQKHQQQMQQREQLQQQQRQRQQQQLAAAQHAQYPPHAAPHKQAPGNPSSTASSYQAPSGGGTQRAHSKPASSTHAQHPSMVAGSQPPLMPANAYPAHSTRPGMPLANAPHNAYRTAPPSGPPAPTASGNPNNAHHPGPARSAVPSPRNPYHYNSAHGGGNSSSQHAMYRNNAEYAPSRHAPFPVNTASTAHSTNARLLQSLPTSYSTHSPRHPRAQRPGSASSSSSASASTSHHQQQQMNARMAGNYTPTRAPSVNVNGASEQNSNSNANNNNPTPPHHQLTAQRSYSSQSTMQSHATQAHRTRPALNSNSHNVPYQDYNAAQSAAAAARAHHHYNTQRMPPAALQHASSRSQHAQYSHAPQHHGAASRAGPPPPRALHPSYHHGAPPTNVPSPFTSSSSTAPVSYPAYRHNPAGMAMPHRSGAPPAQMRPPRYDYNHSAHNDAYSNVSPSETLSNTASGNHASYYHPPAPQQSQAPPQHGSSHNGGNNASRSNPSPQSINSNQTNYTGVASHSSPMTYSRMNVNVNRNHNGAYYTNTTVNTNVNHAGNSNPNSNMEAPAGLQRQRSDTKEHQMFMPNIGSL